MSSIPKAQPHDYVGRWREIISDPINLLIERVDAAGLVEKSGNVILHNGVRVPASGEHAYYDQFSAILLINRGVHEPLEEFIFQEVIKSLDDSPTMLELGAYWGHYSMWLQKARPNATLHLVEPEKLNIDVGRRNFEINNCSGTFTQAFVGHGQFNVTAYMESEKIDKLSILHSDIQGYELEMLKDAKPMLEQRRIERVFVSTHSEEIHTQCRQLLEDLGYRIEVSSNVELETTSSDGLIYATSPNIEEIFAGFEPPSRVDINAASAVELRDLIGKVTLS